MKTPQVINLLEDSVLAFDGDSVIDNTTQIALGSGYGIVSITVNVYIWDLMTNTSPGTATAIEMAYLGDVDMWSIDIADIAGMFTDRHKYVARIVETPSVVNMRAFKINEFCIDNDSLEATTMRLPYQVEIGGGQAWIRWYDSTADFSNPSLIKFQAAAYEGGVGTTYATDTSRVTHRGAVLPVS